MNSETPRDPLIIAKKEISTDIAPSTHQERDCATYGPARTTTLVLSQPMSCCELGEPHAIASSAATQTICLVPPKASRYPNDIPPTVAAPSVARAACHCSGSTTPCIPAIPWRILRAAGSDVARKKTQASTTARNVSTIPAARPGTV